LVSGLLIGGDQFGQLLRLFAGERDGLFRFVE